MLFMGYMVEVRVAMSEVYDRVMHIEVRVVAMFYVSVNESKGIGDGFALE